MYVCVRACARAYVCVRMCVRACAYVCVHLRVCMCACVHVHVCMCACVHASGDALSGLCRSACSVDSLSSASPLNDVQRAGDGEAETEKGVAAPHSHSVETATR